MTSDIQSIPQTPRGFALEPLGTPSDVSPDAPPICDICLSESQPQWQNVSSDNCRMGKKRRDVQTLEAKRFVILVRMLMDPGHPQLGRLSQSDIARATGIHVSHINKLLNVERKGMGTDIIRRMKDGLKIDPAFFFDDKDPEDLNVYVLDARRDKRISRVEEDLAELKALIETKLFSSAPDPVIRKTKR